MEPARRSEEETPTRARTRSAILEAAARVLGRDHAASLAEVADAAGVARSTLHRYFPERADLLDALGGYIEERVTQATARARLDLGPAPAALARLCQVYFETWDLWMLRYTRIALEGCEDPVDPQEVDADLLTLVERGHAEGSIDGDLSALWIQQLLWGLLYGAHELVRAGALPEHEALRLYLKTVDKAVAKG